MELKDDLVGDGDVFGSLPAFLEPVWRDCIKTHEVLQSIVCRQIDNRPTDVTDTKLVL